MGLGDENAGDKDEEGEGEDEGETVGFESSLRGA